FFIFSLSKNHFVFLSIPLLLSPFPPLASRYSSNRSYANYLIVR
ncbi:hypothetical protein HMPREF1554_02248, partial [Porphyromonas gingivalis F0569]